MGYVFHLNVIDIVSNCTMSSTADECVEKVYAVE